MDWGTDRLSIVGGQRLSGEITVAGNKHSMVLAIAAAVARQTDITLENVPDLSETEVLRELVADLGMAAAGKPPTMRLTGRVRSGGIDPALSTKIHGSTYLLPAVLAAYGEVSFGGAGGDKLGNFDWGLPRPVQHMLEVMEDFGVTWERRADGVVAAKASELRSTTVDIMRWSADTTVLNGPRVSGATKTAVLMAAVAGGETVIDNPHVQGATTELLNLIEAMGADVERTARRWVIAAGRRIRQVRHVLEADPVEVVFWQALAAMTGSEFRVVVGDTAATQATLRHELATLTEIGITPRFEGVTMRTGLPCSPYPGRALVGQSTGISTDILPFLVCLMFNATSTSTATDLVWKGRFQYASELRKLGFQSTLAEAVLTVTPSAPQPSSEWLRPTDTRSAASCVLLGLATPGESRIIGASHIYRGHDRFLRKLRGVGAEVSPL